MFSFPGWAGSTADALAVGEGATFARLLGGIGIDTQRRDVEDDASAELLRFPKDRRVAVAGMCAGVLAGRKNLTGPLASPLSRARTLPQV
jgi:hypothetical protein